MGGGRGGRELDLMLNSMTLHVLALSNVVKEKALSGDGFIVYLFRIPVSFHNVKTRNYNNYNSKWVKIF